MTIRRAIFFGLTAIVLLSLLGQSFIDPSSENIALACLVAASSLGMLFYVGRGDALEPQPLSTFAIFGFCMTTQMGALIVQTLAWTPLRSSLYDPFYTFGTLAVYQVIAIGVHITYRFFCVQKPTGTGFVRGLLEWAGVYRTPSVGALWIIGWVGLASFVVFVNEAVLVSPVGKVGRAVGFLAWAPFLIPFYLVEEGKTYCNWPRNRILLIGYAAVIGFLGVVLNTRGVMFFGVTTIGLLSLLAGMRSSSRVTLRAGLHLGALTLVVALVANPVSNFVTAMAIARGLAFRAPAAVKIEKTFQVWRRPDIIAAYKADLRLAMLRRSYDEHYIDNPILARFVMTKFYDNSLHFADRISSEDAHRQLREVTVTFFWAVLPAPVLRLLGVNVAKLDLDYSMGDYLPYLSGGGPLGGHRVGSIIGHGKALLGPLFPFVFAGICLIFFGLMNLLTARRADGRGTVSALGSLQIVTYFITGFAFSALHEAFYFFVRVFWQMVLIYVLAFGFARLMLQSKPRMNALPQVPTWQ